MAAAVNNMPYVRLGTSGLKISKIVLGMMSYGTPEWQNWVLPEEEAIQHIKFAYEAGINTFDTANVPLTFIFAFNLIFDYLVQMYSNGRSEIILGKAIRQLGFPREGIVVMTKVFYAVGKTEKSVLGVADLDAAGYVNQRGLSRKHIFDSVKHSLERLQLDYIDVLQCHRFDPDTPISETMEALHDVVKAGYVRYIGMSSCWAYQFHAMQSYALANKLTPFISMQHNYSLLYREEEREMIPTLQMFGVGSIPWSPLARGLLTRPFGEQTRRSQIDRMINKYTQFDSDKVIVDRVEELSKQRGVSMAQIGLAWSMGRECVSAPVIGTTSLENLKDLLGAIDIKLTKEEMEYLEEPYQPRNIIGHT